MRPNLFIFFFNDNNKKLMKALRKHSLHEKTAASVLLKLFISGNEWCHTTDDYFTKYENVKTIIIH